MNTAPHITEDFIANVLTDYKQLKAEINGIKQTMGTVITGMAANQVSLKQAISGPPSTSEILDGAVDIIKAKHSSQEAKQVATNVFIQLASSSSSDKDNDNVWQEEIGRMSQVVKSLREQLTIAERRDQSQSDLIDQLKGEIAQLKGCKK